MTKYLNRKSVLNFTWTFIISFLVIEGVHHLLMENFEVGFLDNATLGIAGAVALFLAKFHIICCAIPALASAAACAYKNHKHCSHDEEHDGTN